MKSVRFTLGKIAGNLFSLPLLHQLWPPTCVDGVDVDDDDDGDACVNLYWDASCLSPATLRSAITLDDDDKNYLINRSLGSGTHWAPTSS